MTDEERYRAELARLKRAAKRHSSRAKGANLCCCVCNATPAPETRFGPRCEAHKPGPEV